MHKKFFNALYLINIISQAIFTLAIPIGFGFLISWLLVRFAGAPTWLFAIFITLGAISGFVSMIKFVLSAMAALERLENEQRERKNNDKTGNNNE